MPDEMQDALKALSGDPTGTAKESGKKKPTSRASKPTWVRSDGFWDSPSHVYTATGVALVAFLGAVGYMLAAIYGQVTWLF